MFSATTYTIRLATPADDAALRSLAELDSQTSLTTGPVLVGELDGKPEAALSLVDGRVVANPFLPTAQLRAHLRYPKRLLTAQIDAYVNYHATNVTGFWNGSDAWQRPLRIAGQVERAGEIRFPNPTGNVDADERREGKVVPSGWQMQPEYMLARLPGDRSLRFMLVMPFTPRGRHNLVSYLAGSLDPLGKPRLTLLSLPRVVQVWARVPAAR